MINLIGIFLISAIRNLFSEQPDILKSTSMTGMTEWNFGHHLANQIAKYIFWLNHDIDVTKHNLQNRRPDIIFHKRAINDLNYLVVEIKLDSQPSNRDMHKIQEYWMGNELHYTFGACITVESVKTFTITIFHKDKFKEFSQNDSYELKTISINKQQPVLELVEHIATLAKEEDYPKNQSKQQEVKEIIDQLDQLVYKLYDLTDEEIKIVEETK